MRWLVVLVVVLGGCVHDDLVACPDGTACPAGTACDVSHGGCVTPEQLTACDGIAAGDDCGIAGLTGGCFDSVCLPRGCGNRVVEPDEACDDGNVASSDGCRSDCRSNELCGNGTVDSGEECDDGNLLSRDDCDSRCLRETVRTRIVPWSIQLFATTSAYDPVRRQLIVPNPPDSTWIYDGHRWTAVWTPTPYPTPFVYDEDRQAVVTLWSTSSAWNGATWTTIPTIGTPTGTYLTAVHDRTRHRDLLVTGTAIALSAWQLDSSGQWTALGAISTARVSRAVSAVDPQTDEIVVAGYASGPKQWIYDGVAWTETTDPIGIFQLFVDRGELRATAGTTGTTMYARRDHVWVAVPTEDLPTAAVIMRDDHDELVGTDGVRSYVLGAVGWTQRQRLPVTSTHYLFADDMAFHLFELPQPNAGVDPMPAWTIDPDATADAYTTTTPPGIIGRDSAVSVRSLGRRGLVLANGSYLLPCPETACGEVVTLEDTVVFDGTSWTTLEHIADVTTGVGVYDPTQRRILVDSGGPNLWQLRDEDSAWTAAEPNYTRQMSRMAWDASVARFVGVYNNSTEMYELTPTGWVKSELYPDGTLFVTSDERTGGLFAVVGLGTTSVVWERRSGSWHKAETVPKVRITDDAYRSRDGTMMLLASSELGTLAMFRDRTSPTPLETCEAGVDADGDGLAYCDDPDCYWRCSRCPPYTTCRYNYEP